MTDDDRKFMELAVAEARKSRAEDDGPRPLVGVVVVKNGEVLAQAHRGEMGLGDHAEYTALERKLESATLAGATVYTTLEPCTTRNHPKVPCAHRLLERGVNRVVIGMLDPNPNILGRGVLHLRRSRVEVALFPHDLMTQLEELNRDFTRVFANAIAPAVTEDLLQTLRDSPLDEWYLMLNRIYWNRNFSKDPAAIFTHLVEVLGSLSVLVSMKKVKGAPVQKILAKALAWWFALCGKVGVKQASDVLWGKFPGVCPYCQRGVHAHDDCTRRKKEARGPDWTRLAEIAKTNSERKPRTIAEWQQMFGAIYPPSSTDDLSKTFAKLTEEVGELAEAIRVFPAAPGYFLSEAADVFAWLMKINNLVDEEADVPAEERGHGLQREFAAAYPKRCVDCNGALCTCPPILSSTVGRIAHEVSPERSSYEAKGSFMTAEKAAAVFGPPAKQSSAAKL